MSVWYCIPSARPPEEAEKVLKLWRERGYKIALWRDAKDHPFGRVGSNHLIQLITGGPYPGYAASVNKLIAFVMGNDPSAEWFVTGGDDVEPDLNHTAEGIAEECSAHFGWHGNPKAFGIIPGAAYSTAGVMQPTGDRFASGSIDKICGSPWMGREFCLRMYGGKGPFWPEYTRFFMDEELQLVAQKYGVLWQRPDLIHLHRWYGRADKSLTSGTRPTSPPEHLKHQEARWNPEKEIFERRRAAGFPGSEPKTALYGSV